ncbi:hypothetical protein BX600DRAFT_434257 [Xylariales sp. PMI_506]|nr:hypothetical protein BX600DRAFT_434257 [Xylariales sp. PMI_506]
MTMLSSRLVTACLVLLLAQAVRAIAEEDYFEIAGSLPVPEGLSPRHYLQAWPIQRFFRRDTGGCGSGEHTCLELGELGAGSCCPDDMYCFYYSNWTIGCCGMGANCDTGCPTDFYRTNTTSTVVTTITPTSTGTGTNVLLASTETVTTSVCKSRLCDTTGYLCASQFGGNCCVNGQTCVTNGCQGVITSQPTLVSTFNGCSATNDFPCSVGGGCCATGQTCTSTSDSFYCAGTASPPGGLNVTTSGGGGLSQGAKAGIGVGVAGAAAIVIGGLTWFCLRQRRDARSRAQDPSAYDRTQTGHTPTPGAGTGGGGGGVGAMSEVSGPSRGGAHHVHQSGLAYDYFGPAAVPGPYTQVEGHTPDALEHGVPVRPQGPDDIIAPVEIDSGLRKPDAVGDGESADQSTTTAVGSTPAEGQQQQEVFELPGSDVEPSRPAQHYYPAPVSPQEEGELPSPESEHLLSSSVSPGGATL